MMNSLSTVGKQFGMKRTEVEIIRISNTAPTVAAKINVGSNIAEAIMHGN